MKFLQKKILGAYFEFKFVGLFSSIFKFPNPKIMVWEFFCDEELIWN